MGESFDDVIQQHLELKRRNSQLEPTLPISDYLPNDGVYDAEAGRDGAAFDTAEWTGKQRERSRSKPESFLESLEDVWSSGPAFDWGDGKNA